MLRSILTIAIVLTVLIMSAADAKAGPLRRLFGGSQGDSCQGGSCNGFPAVVAPPEKSPAAPAPTVAEVKTETRARQFRPVRNILQALGSRCRCGN